jgi:hypothetical protein
VLEGRLVGLGSVEQSSKALGLVRHDGGFVISNKIIKLDGCKLAHLARGGVRVPGVSTVVVRATGPAALYIDLITTYVCKVCRLVSFDTSLLRFKDIFPLPISLVIAASQMYVDYTLGCFRCI